MIFILPLPLVKNKGFTLVELLVVISIIAILSVVGVSVFSGMQTRARDARRQTDINAIANALDAKKGLSNNYIGITTSDFTSGSIPIDTTTAKYCIATGSAIPATPTTWGAGNACPTAPAGYGQIVANSGNGVTAWKICSRLETNGSFFCKSSLQF